MKHQNFRIPENCIAVRFTQAGVEAIQEAKEVHGISRSIMGSTLRLQADDYAALIVFQVPENQLERLASVGDTTYGVTVFVHPQSLWVSAHQSANPEEISKIPQWLLNWIMGAE